MNAHTKRLAQRRQINQQIAQQDALNRCGYCRLALPPGSVLVVETGAKFCNSDCRDAARERAEAGS